MSYSQNQEESAILNYFKDFKGTFCDIGANDGITFSNSARLIELGWSGVMIEPDKDAFGALKNRYDNNSDVKLLEIAIGSFDGQVTFHKCSDSLVSTAEADRKMYWTNQEFTEVNVDQLTWRSMMSVTGYNRFDFINIDAEGLDWEILKQINLFDVKLICIEPFPNAEPITKYCEGCGMKLIYRSHENLIFGR